MHITAMLTGGAYHLDLVDVMDIVAVPLIFYVGHRLHDAALNYVEPERTLLRPLPPRPPRRV